MIISLIQKGSKYQKGCLRVYETPILKTILLLIENFSVVTDKTTRKLMTLKDFKNIHTAKMVVGVHSYAWYGSKSTPVFFTY